MAQDRYGFIWIATEAALQRFDGHSFKTYKNDPEDPDSLATNEVLLIHVDRRGVLWLGTRNGGLGRYDPAEDRFVHYQQDADDPSSMRSNRVWALHDDRTGALWIGTDVGLSRLDIERDTFTHFQHDPDDPESLGSGVLTVLLESREGELWIGTDEGLGLLEADQVAAVAASSRTARFLRFQHDPQNPKSLGNDVIRALYQDREGSVWVGTSSGIQRFDRESQSFETLPLRGADGELVVDEVPGIVEDLAGDLWIARLTTGLSRLTAADEKGERKLLHYQRDERDPHGLSSNWLLALHVDRSGSLWIGHRDGIDLYDRRRERFSAYRQGPEERFGFSALSVAEDRAGLLWVGTVDDGLLVFDRAQGTVAGYGTGAGESGIPPDEQVMEIFEDRFEELWVGTDSSLVRLDRDRRLRSVYEPDPEDPNALGGPYVRHVLEDHQGRIWVAGITPPQRLVRGEGGQEDSFFTPGAAQPEAEDNAHILDLYEARSGELWIGTTDGLARYDEESDRFIWHHQDPEDGNSLSTNVVTAIYEDAAGLFWLGTDAGLNRWDHSRGEFRHYRENDGLPSDRVVGVLEDEGGRLWLATAAGLSRFDPRTESFRNYDIGDGLHGTVFYIGADHRNDRGEFFFGGGGGLTSFFASRIEEDPVPPAVAFTELRLAGEPARLRRLDPESPLRRSILETRELELDHRQEIFSLEFAALHYTNPRKNRYAYRLEGFEEDWSSTDLQGPVARYTNLDAGEYVFRVKAANPDGVWNEEGATLRITVLPPPWRTWWAYSLYGLALVAGALVYVRSHRKELQRERQVAETERQISRRLREVDKLKDEFLARTSHELRTPLYGITGLAESLADGSRGELPAAVRADLSMVADSGRRLSHLVDDILDFSKLRHRSLELHRRPVDLRPIAEVVLTLSQPLVGERSLKLRNEVPANLPAVDADENRLQQILYNLVGNAIKFTDSGRVEVAASAEEGQVRIRVSDTGVGISVDEQERIFEAFEQADPSMERVHGGTGLGLAVSRQLVELHGGTLEVYSTPGEGSIFSFSVPIAPELESAAERPGAPGLPVERAPVSSEIEVGASGPAEALWGDGVEVPTEAPRVLVVDDEPVNLRVMQSYLTGEPFHLSLASSGKEALRLLAEERFDLVLLDIMMPRVSGYEVCRTLRENHSISELPVIFLTARTQDSDEVTGMTLGANDYLSKPISKDRLLARIRPHLDLLRAHRSLETLLGERTAEVKVLEGLLPICAGCKKIRDDNGVWNQLEQFIDQHSEARFSHGLCPNCVRRYYPDVDPADLESEM